MKSDIDLNITFCVAHPFCGGAPRPGSSPTLAEQWRVLPRLWFYLFPEHQRCWVWALDKPREAHHHTYVGLEWEEWKEGRSKREAETERERGREHRGVFTRLSARSTWRLRDEAWKDEDISSFKGATDALVPWPVKSQRRKSAILFRSLGLNTIPSSIMSHWKILWGEKDTVATFFLQLNSLQMLK